MYETVLSSLQCDSTTYPGNFSALKQQTNQSCSGSLQSKFMCTSWLSLQSNWECEYVSSCPAIFVFFSSEALNISVAIICFWLELVLQDLPQLGTSRLDFSEFWQSVNMLTVLWLVFYHVLNFCGQILCLSTPNVSYCPQTPPTSLQWVGILLFLNIWWNFLSTL